MIEFAPIAFGLAYAYCVIKWLDRPKQWGWVLAGVTCGSVSALAKITSLAAMVPLLAVFSLAALWKEAGSVTPDQRFRLCLRRLSILTVFAVIPLVVGLIWVRYSDGVKSASPLTAWLASQAMGGWNYGSMSQRRMISNWRSIFSRVFEGILPYGTMLLPVLGIAAAMFKTDWKVRSLLLGMLMGVVLPILVFFNLFCIHDYYLCAITPCLAVLAGYGVFVVGGWIDRKNGFGIVVFGAGLALCWLFSYPSYLRSAYDTSYQNPIVELAQVVEKNTPSGKYVLVADDDWNSDILYYSNRRGCMLRDGFGPQDLHTVAYRWLPLNQFTTLVTQHRDDSALGWYHSHEMIMETNGYYIFRVGDPVATENTLK